MRPRPLLFGLLWLGLALGLCACEGEGAGKARANLRERIAPEAKAMISGDITRHVTGVRRAAARLAPGFVLEEAAERPKQLRAALRVLTRPPKGIPELLGSARTFVAAIDAQGVVVATDAKVENDRMTGLDLGKRFALVRDALRGEEGHGIDQFEALEPGGEGSTSLLFAAPALLDGKVVGVVLAGIPLWKLSQRVSKQLQLDHVSEPGVILWAYVYRSGALHHFGTPPDLDTIVPHGQELTAGLARSRGGYTGELMQFGRAYGFGVLPVRALGADTGLVLIRSDP